MDKLTSKRLQQYADGELSSRRAEAVERLLSEQADSKAYLEDISRVGDYIRLMNQESLADVSFGGFSKRVTQQIRESEERASLWSRMKVAVFEFFEYRRAVWIPSAAVIGALILALFFNPVFIDSQSGASSRVASGEDIQLLSAAHTDSFPKQSSQIDSVDFGDSTGTSFAVNDEQGGTIGVVWIVEAP